MGNIPATQIPYGHFIYFHYAITTIAAGQLFHARYTDAKASNLKTAVDVAEIYLILHWWLLFGQDDAGTLPATLCVFFYIGSYDKASEYATRTLLSISLGEDRHQNYGF